MRKMFAAMAALFLMLSTASAVSAHAHMKSTQPANDAVVTAPTHIRLEFSEGLELAFSGIKITGPAKAAVATGAASHGEAGDSVLDVPVAGAMAPGQYTVEWRILSKDGHKTKGTFSFTVKP